MLTRKLFIINSSSPVVVARKIISIQSATLAIAVNNSSSSSSNSGLFKTSRILRSVGNIPEHGTRPSEQKLDHDHEHNNIQHGSASEEVSAQHEDRKIDESLAELELRQKQMRGG